MRLSEAIRLGAMMTPQARGVVEDTDGSRCSLGSAWLAAGLQIHEGHLSGGGLGTRPYSGGSHQYVVVPEGWFKLMELYVPCPECTAVLAGTRTISEQIPHLNDFHRWSRERIADWVELIERQRGLIPQAEQVPPSSKSEIAIAT